MTSVAHTADREVDQLAEILWLCRDDPDLFNAAVLARPDYWSRQLEICRSVAGHRRVVVPSGNVVGKSFLAAGIVLWWLYTRPGSLVVVTAPSQALLGTVLFKEIRRALVSARKYGIPLPGEVTESAKASPQTLLVDQAGHQVIGIATRGVERLSGQHHPDLLVLVDEASGIEDEIWEALDSQNATKEVIFGNPLRAEGRFRELYDRARKEENEASAAAQKGQADPIPTVERTIAIRIPSTESPDIHLDRSPRGLADAGFLRDKERQYGRDSLWWRCHILALFPDVSVDVLIPPEWFDACHLVTPPQPGTGGPRRIAIDLAEGVGRDQSCVLVRDDLQVLEVWCSSTGGLKETAAWAKTLRIKYGVEPWRISYDALGIGKGFDNDLAGVGIVGAVPYHGSGSGGAEFVNLRSRAGWNLRCRLNPDWTLDPPADPRTGAISLAAPRVKQPPFYIPPWIGGDGSNAVVLMREDITQMRYELVGQKTKLENKLDLCKRLGRSDDCGGSLLQSFAFSG